jgi:hypothetical protein
MHATVMERGKKYLVFYVNDFIPFYSIRLLTRNNFVICPITPAITNNYLIYACLQIPYCVMNVDECRHQYNYRAFPFIQI